MRGTLNDQSLIYLQIARMLEDDILRGVYQEEEQVPSTNELARGYNINPATAAKGINLLVADGGYPGFVVKLAGEFEEICFCPASKGGKPQLTAGGAALLSTLSKTALYWGLTGLEFASGIPGSVGGAVTMNAGAYGGEIAQSLLCVCAVSLDGEEKNFKGSECGFGYRRSIFSGGDWQLFRH